MPIATLKRPRIFNRLGWEAIFTRDYAFLLLSFVYVLRYEALLTDGLIQKRQWEKTKLDTYVIDGGTLWELGTRTHLNTHIHQI